MFLPVERIAGIVVLVSYALLVAAKVAAAGSLLKDRPQSGVWLWLTHIFNSLYLLLAVPCAGILLILARPGALDPAVLAGWTPRLPAVARAGGMLLYCTGCFLLAWALLTLRENYQVGGSAPRPADELVTRGPYRLVRHPMYSAALCISLGLACLTNSLLYFYWFCVYVPLIVLLVPFEEKGLSRRYGEPYAAYCRAVKRLVPLLY